MKKIVCLIFFALFSPPLKAMLWEQLSVIEKQLIYREIGTQGIAAIRQKIENTPSPKPLQSKLMFIEEICKPILKIEGVFYKSEVSIDPLTQAIFDEIEEIEKKSGYIPQQIIQKDHGNYMVTQATNSIGQGTRYYWLTENNSPIPAVRIETTLCDKKSLLELINSYKPE